MAKKLKSYRFDEHTLELIEELKESLHLENNSHVIRRAITLLKLASDTTNNGGQLIFREDGKEKELIL